MAAKKAKKKAPVKKAPVKKAPSKKAPSKKAPSKKAKAAPRATSHKSEAAERIFARARAEGRKLRQDEKAKVYGPSLLLAKKYEEHPIDPKGWWQSEKLDGVRAFWDGQRFVSRQGNVFSAPTFFKKGLGKEALDGELWMGRRKFQETSSVIKRQGEPDRWKKLKYLVFDAPGHNGSFEERMAAMRKIVERARNKQILVVDQRKSLGREDLKRSLDAVVRAGGEGLMLRKPGSRYVGKRSDTLLKVKKFRDAEARVIGHQPGKGRNRGALGALLVKMPNGKTFEIGTGFSDAVRLRPPKIGSKVTYRYVDTTSDGIPKGVSFVAVRDYE